MKIIEKVSLWVAVILVAVLILLTLTLSLSGCSPEVIGPSIPFNESFVNVGTHKLKTFSFSTASQYLVVFESGLGNDHGIWNVKDITGRISTHADILLYDRAGYGGSDQNIEARGIDKLSDELNAVVDHYANGRKVVLVGHSLGGMIIRDYAIKHPSKTGALLFVDASHELYNHPTQEEEDMAYDNSKKTAGANYGGTLEIKELVENAMYLADLPNLPDIPVIALTSMRTDPQHDSADKQLWYDSKEALRPGVSDFTHITTTNSGHYIQIDEPQLVVDNIKLLLSKLP